MAQENAAGLLSQRQELIRVIMCHRPDVIIAAAKHSGEKAPCLLPVQTLERLPCDTVIVDLNATRGGNVAGSRVDQQLRTDGGVWICNRANYPNAEPAEASSAYAACLVGILSVKASTSNARCYRAICRPRLAPARHAPRH